MQKERRGGVSDEETVALSKEGADDRREEPQNGRSLDSCIIMAKAGPLSIGL